MSSKKRVYTVLVIDGGGVRGVIPAHFLKEMEEKTGKHTTELFDMIAVSSGGSLVGASLTVPDEKDKKKPRFTAKDIIKTFKEKCRSIFPNIKYRNLKHFVPGADGFYDVENFENILKDLYGDTKMGDSLSNLVITAADMKSMRPVWIENIKEQSDKDGWKNMDLWDAVRATCTAPSLFQTRYFYTSPNPETPDVQERYVFLDGNIFGSVAPRYAYTKAKHVAPPDAEIVVVHLGTGYQQHSASPDEFNESSPMTLLKDTVGLMIYMNLKATLDDLEAEIGDRLFSFDEQIDKYAPDINPSIRMDEAGEDNMEELSKFAERQIKERGEDMDRLCDILKNKVYVDEAFTHSRKALREVTDILADTKTPKELNVVYTKVVKYSSDMEIDTKDVPKDDLEIFELARCLREEHMSKLDRIVGVLREKKAYQNSPPSKFKRGLKAVFMPWTLWKKKDEPSNDNKKDDQHRKHPKKHNGPKR